MAKPRKSSGKKQLLRETLIHAAEAIIEQHGYQALQAREVAAVARCSSGAVYTVFENLDGLIVAVKERTLDNLQQEIVARLAEAERMAEALPARQAAERSLHALADYYLSFATTHPKLWRTIFEHPNPPDMPPDAYMQKLSDVLSYIEGPLEVLTPQLTPEEKTLWARALFSAVHGIVALGIDQKLGPLSLEALKWQMRALVHAAVVGAFASPP